MENKEDMFKMEWENSKEKAAQPVNGFYNLTSIQKEGFEALKGARHSSLIAPTGCGKSWLICALISDKHIKDKNVRSIIAVPQKDIGNGFRNNKFKLPDGTDVKFNPVLYFCDDNRDTVNNIIKFLEKKHVYLKEDIFVCTHHSLVGAFTRLRAEGKLDLLKNLNVWIDEGHHVNNDFSEDTETVVSNRLGDFVLHCLKNTETVSVNLATASFFRGDQGNIIPEMYKNEFVTFSVAIDRYLETMIHLKSLSFSYILSPDPYEDTIENLYKYKVGKTIIYIPKVNSTAQQKDKCSQTEAIIKVIQTGRKLEVIDLVNEEGRDERKALIGDGRNKKIDAIVSLGMFKEGSNWVDADRAIVLGPRNSLVEVVQILGRLLRDCPKKSHVEFCMVLPFSLDAMDKENFKNNLNDFQKCVFLSMLVENKFNPVKLKAPKDKDSKVKCDGSGRVDFLESIIPDETDRASVLADISEAARDFAAENEDRSDSSELLRDNLPDIVEGILKDYGFDEYHTDEIADQIWRMWRRRSLKMRGMDASEIQLDLIDEVHPLDFMLRYGSGAHGIKTFKDLKAVFSRYNWLPFEEAREFARGLNFKYKTEWYEFVKNNNITNIPRNPNQAYKESWGGWDDFLNKETVKYNHKNDNKFLSYFELKEAVRKLNINSNEEYSNRYREISGAPSAPNQIYTEWENWPMFLGKKKYSTY